MSNVDRAPTARTARPPAAPTRRSRILGLLLLAAVIAVGCGEDDEPAAGAAPFNPYAGYRSVRYADDALWLCRPGLARDRCFDDIDATEVHPDGSLQIVPYVPAQNPPFDCFYVYPTVNLSVVPGNDTDFSDVSLKLDPLLSQAARFTRLCRVFAPLYRQVTIGTGNAPNSEALRAIAYDDVLDAFKHYMGQYNQGRTFVLMGHSQGTGMLSRLMREEFDETRLREQLISALLVGGGVYVPRGAVVGGTFQHIPICSRAGETGCVIAYHSFDAAAPPAANGSTADGLPAGMETACTNPAALGGGPARFAGSYFPNFVNQPLFRGNRIGPPGVETPFTLFRDYYAGECVTRADGVRYLEISAAPPAGDQRAPGSLRNALVESLGLGLHLVDYNLALEDLIALVETQAQAFTATPFPAPRRSPAPHPAPSSRRSSPRERSLGP